MRLVPPRAFRAGGGAAGRSGAAGAAGERRPASTST